MRQPLLKPDFVPEGAIWDAGEHHWELSPTNDRGERDGESLLYRDDGRLYARRRFRAGVLDGPFRVYHPSGAVAREGSYAGGVFDGAIVAYASETPSPERLRSCCVPENAWELRALYRSGSLESETFYDRQGRALLDDGTLRPDKPSHIDPAARFDESLRRWRLDLPARAPGTSRMRYWSPEGALLEDVEYLGGRTFSHLYDAEGRVRKECGFTDRNQLDGPYRHRFAGHDESPYADRRVAEERGTYERGQAVGTWAFLDNAGQIVRTVERGPAISDEIANASPVFAEAATDRDAAAHWQGLAARLVAEGRLRESLCAAARAAAGMGDAADLRRFIDEHVPALRPELGEQRGEGLVASPDVTLTGTLNALLTGADPAAALRTLAAVATGAVHAARDFIEASLLLDPRRRMSHLTRALVRVELGDDKGALDDAALLEPASESAAEFVRSYVRVVFPVLTFPPALEGLAGPGETLEVAPEQPLEEVRRAIRVYATRLALVRDALSARIGGGAPRWMPPAPSHLLPDGPATLRSFEAVITDDTENGPEETRVRIEERIDTRGRSIPALLRAARYDWCALSWLCWSIGQDEMAWPERLSPRPEFAAAASMSVARFWRANDRLTTGGLIARSQGVPGFVWEGMDIDGMPANLAEIAAGEYVELRAMFLWLASGDNLSPFQSDLRLG